jgi:hypothetical protein
VSYPKSVHLEIRVARIGTSLVAMTTVGGVSVRGQRVAAGVRFEGLSLPVEDDTANELRAVQSLLDMLSRTDGGTREVDDARLGLELELAGSTLQEAAAALPAGDGAGGD